MNEFTVDVSMANVLLGLRNGQKRVRYAIANAERATILEVQEAERTNVRSRFEVRKRDFIERQAAIIKPFPTPDTLMTKIAVGQKPRLLLSTFESGGQRLPFRGRKMAIPVIGGPARPTFAQSVPEAFTFKGLSLRRVTAKGQQKRRRRTDVSVIRRLTGTGAIQWKGEHRTFVIQSSAKLPEGGVFQRVGPGKDDIRLVYSFRANIARLDNRLGFVRTARDLIARQFPKRLQDQVVETFRYQLARASGLA